jgi:protein-glutamine gamma-glutamyltransferase
VRRTLAAAAVPAIAVSVAWLRLEEPRRGGEVLAIAALALVPALLSRWWQRALTLATTSLVALWIGAGIRPWDVRHPGEEGVVEPVVRSVSHGLGDYYGVALPFDPSRHAEMHMLLLAAVFGFVAAIGLLVAARHAVAAAAVAVAGVGWPATLVDAGAVGSGALALAAALSVFVFLRLRSARALASGAVVAGIVVSGAAWASSATTLAQSAILNWESWDFRGLPQSALGVRFVWDANYDGVSFPPTQTVVLEIRGPERAQYWRVSTLDRFTADRWFENLYPQLVGGGDGRVPLDSLAPRRARLESEWLEQRVHVRALVDDRLAAAGTPVALTAKSLETVFYLDGGVMRARRALSAGTRYRVWSYVPDPSPAALAAAPATYPRASRRHLTVWGRDLPPFGDEGRDEHVRSLLDDAQYPAFGEYRPMYETARRVAGDAASPYAAVLALEEWFRSEGGFRYDEQPPPSGDLPPLVHFVMSSRAGYCQHYAGAMAVMLRLLGVPARVAVGFTSGTQVGGVWRVTDHNAHAWVEVWFPRHGWVAFDPTPGRGTFSGIYSFASENAQAVAALGRGALEEVDELTGRGLSEREAGPFPEPSRESTRPSLLILVLGLAVTIGAGIGVAKW